MRPFLFAKTRRSRTSVVVVVLILLGNYSTYVRWLSSAIEIVRKVSAVLPVGRITAEYMVLAGDLYTYIDALASAIFS